MASVEGGMDIEESHDETGGSRQVAVDPITGVDAAKARRDRRRGRVPGRRRREVADVTIVKLWDVFVKEDATLVEVNPLVKTPMVIPGTRRQGPLDDNADFRHPDHEELVDIAATDPLEVKARRRAELRQALRRGRHHR